MVLYRVSSKEWEEASFFVAMICETHLGFYVVNLTIDDLQFVIWLWYCQHIVSKVILSPKQFFKYC